MTTNNTNTIRLHRVLQAPPERVYRAFLDADAVAKWLVIEKMSGEVKVVENGAVVGIALDLAVNNASERGLLGIALHPDFESNGFVYLFWSCIAPPPPASAPFFPSAEE